MKLVISTLADVPEGLRDQYEQRGSAFHLKIEDAATAETHPAFEPLKQKIVDLTNKVSEFRDTNVGLNRKMKEVTDALGDLAPSDVPALKAKLADLEKQAKGKPAEFKTELESALKPLRDQIVQLENQNKQSEAEKKAANASLAKKGLENALQTAGVKAGVDERAIDDFVQRGLKVFVLDDEGNLVPKSSDGKTIYSKSRAGETLSVDEWAAGPAKEAAPHLFKPSNGGGADPKAGNSGGGGAKKVINDGDFLSNLEDLAAGKARLNA